MEVTAPGGSPAKAEPQRMPCGSLGSGGFASGGLPLSHRAFPPGQGALTGRLATAGWGWGSEAANERALVGAGQGAPGMAGHLRGARPWRREPGRRPRPHWYLGRAMLRKNIAHGGIETMLGYRHVPGRSCLLIQETPFCSVGLWNPETI